MSKRLKEPDVTCVNCSHLRRTEGGWDEDEPVVGYRCIREPQTEIVSPAAECCKWFEVKECLDRHALKLEEV